jgi:outer membrane receptor protein involved in Fe transport
MNSVPSYQKHRAGKYLVTCLAALVAVSAPSLRATAADDLAKLQEENAALRKQNAELEAQKSAATTTTTTTTTAAPATTSTTATDEGVTTMSKFTVATDHDNGYLKTNSATATRIGMEVQRTPLAIEIKSAEFLADTNTQSLTDILRYTSSGSGDNNFAMARPANGATPQGAFTMRGFQVNTLLRNGVKRYTDFSLDDTERVEIIKGPAALFFGNGEPGGVINYITKQPVFARIPTTLAYITGTDQKQKWVLDTNQMFSPKAALRIVASSENSGGQRRFEFTKSDSFVGSLAIVPFDSGKLRITAEAEYSQLKYNQTRGNEWYYPQGWFDAYANTQSAPGAASLVTLEQGAVANGFSLAGNAIGSAGAAALMASRYNIIGGYGNWGTDLRTGTGNYTTPNYTRIERGAYYLDANGNKIHDTGFNWDARGAFNNDAVRTVDVTFEVSPFEWVDGRYVITADNNRFDDNEGGYAPYADGRQFSSFGGVAANSAGYYSKTTDHQFDLIFKKDFWGLKNKLLVGGTFHENIQQYNAQAYLNYALIPGANNATGNPGYIYTGGTATQGANTIPANQVIRDRYGNIKTVVQVFNNWDPGYEIQPDIHPLLVIDRVLLDGYYSQEQAGYINYQGQAFDDRLTILGGVRREEHRDSGQYLTSNFPYYAPPPSAYYDTVTYPPGVYNYDPGYAGDRDGEHSRVAGTAWMVGLSYQIKKDINVYVSTSKIYNRNGATNAGGFSTLAVPLWYQAANYYLGSLPGGNAAHPFVYNGQTINSVTDLFNALHANGADVLIKPETGRNSEVGVKTSLWDDKLVGTLSFFHTFRVNRRIDDTNSQNIDALNYTNNYQYFGTPAVAATNPYGNFSGSRLLRWRTVGQKDIIEGADFETTWSPIKNFQTVINGAWLWTAKTDNAPTIPKPGSAAYNAFNLATPAGMAAKVNSDIYYGARLENVPEYRLNSFSKYTITDGFFHGLSLALGTRYSSKMVVSRDVTWNPLNGGFQAGNYFVFDANVSYPWELAGYKIQTTFSVQNLTDKLYFESSAVVASPGRQLFITNKLSF